MFSRQRMKAEIGLNGVCVRESQVIDALGPLPPDAVFVIKGTATNLRRHDEEACSTLKGLYSNRNHDLAGRKT